MASPTKEQIAEKVAKKRNSKHNPSDKNETLIPNSSDKNENSIPNSSDKNETPIPNSDVKAGEFNEYEGNVLHEGYDDTIPQIKGAGTGEIIIPEFVPERQIINLEKPVETKTNEKLQSEPPKSQQPPKPQSTEPINPELADVDTTEAKKAAERFADKILKLYALVHTWSYLGLNLEDEKLKKRAMHGKFDMDALNIPIPISETEEMTVKEWLDSYNIGIRRTLNYDINTGQCVLPKEFIDEVRPPMIREFTKHGIGMTDLQTILFGFGQDVFDKGTKLVGLRISINSLLHGVNEILQKTKNPTPTRPPKQQQKPETQQNQQPTDIETPQSTTLPTVIIKTQQEITDETIQEVPEKEL